MNILFLTLLDFTSIDENGIYTDLIREFVKDEYNVYIVSPTEKRKKESTQLIDNGNLKILKLQIGNIQKTNLFEKGISMLTLENKYQHGIKKYFKDVKFDLVLYSTPPITLQKAVEYVKNRDQANTYLLLKDIFPQNAVDLGLLKTYGIRSLIYKYFKKKEEDLYKISDYIGCMSEANVDFILKNNPTLTNKIIEVCPNSIEPLDSSISLETRKWVREKYDIPPNKTIFIYGGNLGKPQGIDFLIDCIGVNECNDESFFIIVGSGTEAGKLQGYFKRESPNNAMFINQLSKDEYELLANSCDVGLIFLDSRFTIPNFPSRLLSYMQASMPVLSATDINTDVGFVIEKGNFGYSCVSNNVERFNELVLRLCDKDLRTKLGRNSREYLENHYSSRHSYEVIMKHFNE